METEKTVVLRKLVTIGDVVYEKLDLREPTAGDLEKASSATSQMGLVINLIQIVAKVPRKVIESLCQRDLKEASAFLESFSEDSQGTGETSLQT